MNRIMFYMLVPIGFGLCGCRPSASDSKNAPEEPRALQQQKMMPELIHDAGNVSIDAGPQRVEHTFKIRNKTGNRTSLNVATSCACLQAVAGAQELDPDESTTLNLVMEVKSPGARTATATVRFSDQTMRAYTLKAWGDLGLELILIQPTPYIDAKARRLPVRLLLIDSHGDGETEPPQLVGPAGVRMDFTGWNTLELHSRLPVRPTRQIGNGVLNFTEYAGEYPVKLELRTRRGARCEFETEVEGLFDSADSGSAASLSAP